MTKRSAVARPLSPHLTIYKPQITSVLSIAHRITGFAMFISMIVIAWWVINSIYGCFECATSLLSLWFIKTLLFFVLLGLFYHMLNGIRHLFWDMGFGYRLKSVNLSGVIVLLLAASLTIVTWALLTSDLVSFV